MVPLTLIGTSNRRKFGTFPDITCAKIQFSRSVRGTRLMTLTNCEPVGASSGRGGRLRFCPFVPSNEWKIKNAIRYLVFRNVTGMTMYLALNDAGHIRDHLNVQLGVIAQHEF